MLNEERGPGPRSDRLNGRHGGDPIAPAGVDVLNPAFDVTPAALITGIITERGVLTPAEVARQFRRTSADNRCSDEHVRIKQTRSTLFRRTESYRARSRTARERANRSGVPFWLSGRSTASVPRSDFDIGIDAGHPIGPEILMRIREAFDSLPIFQKVEVVDFAGVDEAFKAVARKATRMLYERKAA